MSKMNDYIQQETITGIVPMTNKDRQYSFWDLFLSTSGFAIATWCYTQGAYVAQYLTFNQMLINIFSFNIIWVFIECLPILFAVKYGIDLWIWLRAVLGKRGVALLSTIISLANFGWLSLIHICCKRVVYINQYRMDDYAQYLYQEKGTELTHLPLETVQTALQEADLI